MIIECAIGEKKYATNTAEPINLAIDLDFQGAQPNHFDSPKATTKPLQLGGFIGSTKQGGSCNCHVIEFIPHTNGTHTECVGHIVNENLHVSTMLQDTLLPTTLITVEPKEFGHTNNHYEPKPEAHEFVITSQSLEKALSQQSQKDFLQALVIRTLPNTLEKKSKAYTDAPFFSFEAIEFLNNMQIQHLLVDLPTIDRTHDQGRLFNHRAFWQVKPQEKTLAGKEPSRKTITEMIYVPESIPDGHYLLNLQLPAMLTDAVPSRPLLYTLEAV